MASLVYFVLEPELEVIEHDLNGVEQHAVLWSLPPQVASPHYTHLHVIALVFLYHHIDHELPSAHLLPLV